MVWVQRISLRLRPLLERKSAAGQLDDEIPFR